ncbi:hypothetical protein ASPWEDRAFT_168638 [Aspergillus wentii DTO 134E9]|uniref:NADP-dependent oxidoreductase domain-containing protein n=1 Tax=Aspergillus wentii DTO 134E9 TaxID=1073089 RepID=A0A1L9RUZ6_ASPWE|nr:uncharacterized protein ASPWEDRAFT_168638 [Aspergillus wentii DTO 134E9]OJJ38750.1 hypothetical protein ASPWEDRAFT_168638 [Aspergillus wentii DTO 134E9]
MGQHGSPRQRRTSKKYRGRQFQHPTFARPALRDAYSSIRATNRASSLARLETVTRVRPGQGIAITAYCSFRPTSSVAGKSTAATKYTSLLQHGLIQELQSTSQVLLRWVTQRGIAIISKSRDEERMRLNLDGEWKLRDEEIERISSLDAGVRFNDPVDHGFDVPVFE